MKKLLSILLALACVMTLVACGKKDDDHTTDPTPTPDPQPAVTTAEYTHGYVDMMLELPEGWSWRTPATTAPTKPRASGSIRPTTPPSATRCCAGRAATASAAPASPVRG